jgi:SAM-dependent methyltransferase
MTNRFRAITETADMRADSDQFAMAQLRHSLVAMLARDGDLLDVACGSGYALPLIAQHARSVTACDRNPTNVRDARAALPSGSVRVADAERLPFPENSFDLIACLEAIYYFQDWRGHVRQASRLLRPGGSLVVTWPNPSRPAFNPSPASTVYPTAEEMTAVADSAGLDGVCFGAFPFDDLATAQRPWLDVVRRTVVRLHLVPHSLRLRSVVKRVLYHNLTPLSEITLLPDPFQHLVKLTPDMDANFAMLYFVGVAGPETHR